MNDRSSIAIQNEIKKIILKQGDLDLVKEIELTTFWSRKNRFKRL